MLCSSCCSCFSRYSGLRPFSAARERLGQKASKKPGVSKGHHLAGPHALEGLPSLSDTHNSFSAMQSSSRQRGAARGTVQRGSMPQQPSRSTYDVCALSLRSSASPSSPSAARAQSGSALSLAQVLAASAAAASAAIWYWVLTGLCAVKSESGNGCPPQQSPH